VAVVRRIARYSAYAIAGLTGLALVVVVALAVTGAIVLETSLPDYNGRDSIPQ